MSKSAVFLSGVILLAVLAGFFAYTGSPLAKFRPWRLGLDLVGGTQLIYEVDMSATEAGDRDAVLGGLRDVIERRVNLFGVSEPNVVTSKAGGSHRILVELAGIKDVNEAIRNIGETPFLFFGVVDKEKSTSTASVVFKPTMLTGRYVKRAQLILDQVVGNPQVGLEFDSEGAKIFEELTGRNVGEPIAVYLDNVLISAPRVSEKISGGRAVITGRFTYKEAKQLVERFNAGALPAPINLINQQTIGASLGRDSLLKMIWAGIWGAAAVVLFMLVYYRKLGLFSSLALLLYIAFTLAVFKLLGVTMTLAGIAGFILSIGMAVDANVLVFERTKEEIRGGASWASAIEAGFDRAWTSIRDSNLTTMLTAIILFYFTSSFVKGFALTLFIGVLVSMFSAITVTRNLLRVFMR